MTTPITLSDDITAALAGFTQAYATLADAERESDVQAMNLAKARGIARQRLYDAAKASKERLTEALMDAAIGQDADVALYERQYSESRAAVRVAQGGVEVQREYVRFLRITMQRDIAQAQGVME